MFPGAWPQKFALVPNEKVTNHIKERIETPVNKWWPRDLSLARQRNASIQCHQIKFQKFNDWAIRELPHGTAKSFRLPIFFYSSSWISRIAPPPFKTSGPRWVGFIGERPTWYDSRGTPWWLASWKRWELCNQLITNRSGGSECDVSQRLLFQELMKLFVNLRNKPSTCTWTQPTELESGYMSENRKAS